MKRKELDKMKNYSAIVDTDTEKYALMGICRQHGLEAYPSAYYGGKFHLVFTTDATTFQNINTEWETWLSNNAK